MNESEFNSLYHCDFRVEPEFDRLLGRLNTYYAKTPDSAPNQVAIQHWRDFKMWCDSYGYTNEDINRAKRSLAK